MGLALREGTKEEAPGVCPFLFVLFDFVFIYIYVCL